MARQIKMPWEREFTRRVEKLGVSSAINNNHSTTDDAPCKVVKMTPEMFVESGRGILYSNRAEGFTLLCPGYMHGTHNIEVRIYKEN